MRKTVKVGNVEIGSGKIVIQSMTNTPTSDVKKTLEQIRRLENEGCEIIRLAVSNLDEVNASKEIIKRASVPLVADIQFDYRLAIACSEIGYSGIRFNPGNIGGEQKIKELVSASKKNRVPIRVGANSGSLDKELEKKYGKTPKALALSVLQSVVLLEENDFTDIVVSVKSSCVKTTIEANRILHKKCNYPLHIGLTESGVGLDGIIKSSIAIGTLLLDGIGDTVRVSLTGDPVEEVKIAKKIIAATTEQKYGVEIISCPTCSRCSVDLEKIAKEAQKMCEGITHPLKIAVMGCSVNGPGEAKDADLGLAFSNDSVALFIQGKIIKTAEKSLALDLLKEQIKAKKVY